MAHRIQSIWNDGATPIIIRLSFYSVEQDALNEEVRLISSIGRRDLSIGPLVNKTNGGEAGIPYKWDRERKEKWSVKTLPKLKGSHTINLENQAKMQAGVRSMWKDPIRREEHCKKLSENSSKYWLGKRFSDARRANMSAVSKGRKQSSEQIAKRVAALSGRIKPGKISITIHKIEYPSIRKACAALKVSYALAKKMAGD